jgi:hypothetical protein
MRCLKNRLHHIIPQLFPAREKSVFSLHVVASLRGGFSGQLCFQCLFLVFNRLVKKDVEICRVTKVTTRHSGPFYALHCIECEDEFFVKIYVACLMDAARRGEIHRILAFA